MTTENAPSRWMPVVAYALVSAANQMLWLTFTPITSDAADHYGVSVGAIGWLAEVFPLLYVVLALPAGRVIDRWLAPGLAAGAVLTAAGALLRVFAPGYSLVLVAQVAIAVAQPLVLNAVTKLSGTYLRTDDRPTGIAVSSAGIFAGMVLALVLGTVVGGHRIGVLLAVEAGFAVVAAVLLCAALRHPGAHADTSAVVVRLRAVWADGYLRVLTGLVCVGFGVFIALTTWLQALLRPAGVSESAAGTLLVVMVVAGVIGSATLPAWLARHRRQIAFVLVSVAAGVACLVVLAALPRFSTGLPVLLVFGVLLLTDLPIILELAARRAGRAGGTATGLLWLAGNAAGLVVALLVQALLGHPGVAFVVLAACLLPGFPLLWALRSQAGRPAPHTGPSTRST